MKELMDAEQVDVEEKAIRYIAKATDGSMRDAFKSSGSVYCVLSGAKADI